MKYLLTLLLTIACCTPTHFTQAAANNANWDMQATIEDLLRQLERYSELQEINEEEMAAVKKITLISCNNLSKQKKNI